MQNKSKLELGPKLICQNIFCSNKDRERKKDFLLVPIYLMMM